MRYFMLFILALFLLGCAPDHPLESDDGLVSHSDCERISEPNRKLLCQAMETKDYTLCSEIEGRFKEECVVTLAELVDSAPASFCDLSEVKTNQIICKALLAHDTGICLEREQGEGISAALGMRDCVDLVARKLGDSSVCDTFKDSAFMTVCGDTSECEGQFGDSSYQIEDCVLNIEG